MTTSGVIPASASLRNELCVTFSPFPEAKKQGSAEIFLPRSTILGMGKKNTFTLTT